MGCNTTIRVKKRYKYRKNATAYDRGVPTQARSLSPPPAQEPESQNLNRINSLDDLRINASTPGNKNY